MPAQRVLMYSFKGGAGRTVTMANIGYILAKLMKLRVLCIDLDIESAGASVLFKCDKQVTTQHIWTLQDIMQGSYKTSTDIVETIDLAIRDFAGSLWPRMHLQIFPQYPVDNTEDGVLDFLPARSIIESEVAPYYHDEDTQTNYENLLFKINSDTYSPPDIIIIDSASGTQDAASLGILNCDTLIIFMRWSRQFTEGTKRFIKQLASGKRHFSKDKIKRIFVVPTAVPELNTSLNIPSESRMKEAFTLRKDDLKAFVDNINSRIHHNYPHTPENIITILDPIPECHSLKWDDRIFLMDEDALSDDDNKVVESYIRLAQIISTDPLERIEK